MNGVVSLRIVTLLVAGYKSFIACLGKSRLRTVTVSDDCCFGRHRHTRAHALITRSSVICGRHFTRKVTSKSIPSFPALVQIMIKYGLLNIEQ